MFGTSESPRKKRLGMGWVTNGQRDKVGVWIYIRSRYYYWAWS